MLYDFVELATECFVFMVVAINKLWIVVPIGYFLVNQFISTLKSELVKRSFDLLNKTDIKA